MPRRTGAALGAFVLVLAVIDHSGCVNVCAEEIESTGLGGSGPGPSCVRIPLPREGDAGDTAGTGGTGGSTSGRPVEVNGCSASTAIDHTAESKVTITFEGGEYVPRCIRVKVGTVVTFIGDFASHPLWGATLLDAGNANDDLSPFPFPPKDSGTSLDVTMPRPGTFPYVCTKHYHQGMVGAVIVESR